MLNSALISSPETFTNLIWEQVFVKQPIMLMIVMVILIFLSFKSITSISIININKYVQFVH